MRDNKRKENNSSLPGDISPAGQPAPTTVKKRTEAVVTAEITAYLRKLKPACWYNKNAGFANHFEGSTRFMRQKKGIPDLVVIYGGVTVWFEIKSPTGRLSADQIAQHAAMREAGARVYVVRSVEDVKAVFAGKEPAHPERKKRTA